MSGERHVDSRRLCAQGTLDAMLHGSLWSPSEQVKEDAKAYVDEVGLVLSCLVTTTSQLIEYHIHVAYKKHTHLSHKHRS